MSKKTRQQRRARSRAPLKRKRRGSSAFLAFLLLVLLGGGGLIAAFRLNRPPLTRGAIAGEHWHASYAIFICGRQVTNFPNVEGELHSHGDGFMHIHPSTPAATANLASLGTFLRTYQTSIGTKPDGKRNLTFPGGTSYTDGDKCPNDEKKYDIEVTNKGKEFEGDPATLIPHDGDAIVIKFGPEGKKTMPNPYSKEMGLPDAGIAGSRTPVPDTAPKTPEGPPPEEPEGTPEGTGE